MPINPKLKAIIEADATMTNDYKQRLIETMDNAPADFQNNWMAREDYTRQANQLKLDREAMETKNRDFYRQSETNIGLWKDEIKRANDMVAEREARIAELTAARGGTGLEGNDAITKEINRLNATITALQTGIDEKIKGVVTAQDLEKTGAQWAGYIGAQVLELNELSWKHQQTFGTRLGKADNEALITYANEQSAKLKRSIGLEEAYNMKYGTEIATKHDEEVARAAVEKYKTQSEVPGGGPVGPGAGAPERGPLQIRMQQEQLLRDGKGTEGVPRNLEEAIRMAADELVKEGKG
jgi:hypothetical protein